jgi:hypothetical protein
MSLPIIAVFGDTITPLDRACFETRLAESISVQTIEDAITSSDGVIIDGTLPSALFTVALALEKYGRPTALINGADTAFTATITRPTFLASAEPAAIHTFFTKHFPAPVDPTCAGDVCRV